MVTAKGTGERLLSRLQTGRLKDSKTFSCGGIWDCLRDESPTVTEFQQYRQGGEIFREVKQVGESGDTRRQAKCS
jgi:hypothetical protein